MGHAIYAFGVVFTKDQHGEIGFAFGHLQNESGALLHSGPCRFGFLQTVFVNSKGGHVLYVFGAARSKESNGDIHFVFCTTQNWT